MKNELDLHRYKKIAIMGGTFDPIHYGHLVTARAVGEGLGIEKVIFMPTGNPPHKRREITDALSRYAMTCLAASGEEDFAVSRIETDRQGMSYTMDTVKQLMELCDKKCKIYFIVGADALSEITTWYKPEELMRLCRFIAVTRPGTKVRELKAYAMQLEKEYGAHIRLMEVPAMDISSTDIRNRVFAGMSISLLTPPEVCTYIRDNGFYAADEEKYANIRKKLYGVLSPKRFLHTRGVAEEAKRLAAVHGCDTDKAYLAGLLHDCAKDMDKQRSLQMCKKYDMELDKVLKTQPDLIHSFLGSVLAEKEYGIKDSDIINAVRYHTTGRADMSVLEKIIYLADFFEPSRKSFDGIERIRSLAYEDLDAAMDFSLDHTISYNNKKGRLIHPLSLKAAEFYRDKMKGRI